MKKRTNFYIFFVISYLITLGVVRASAYESLEMSKYDPSICEHSLFFQLAANR